MNYWYPYYTVLDCFVLVQEELHETGGFCILNIPFNLS